MKSGYHVCPYHDKLQAVSIEAKGAYNKLPRATHGKHLVLNKK